MPRVHTKTKSTRGREYRCGRCGAVIEPGQFYYSWSFRYGGTHFRCSEHRPRQSELTQSKMSDVYAAQEEIADILAQDFEQEDIESVAEAAAERIREVADEYREAAEAMGDAGYENEERADEVEEIADAIETAIENAEREDFESDEDWREAVRGDLGTVV